MSVTQIGNPSAAFNSLVDRHLLPGESVIARCSVYSHLALTSSRVILSFTTYHSTNDLLGPQKSTVVKDVLLAATPLMPLMMLSETLDDIPTKTKEHLAAFKYSDLNLATLEKGFHKRNLIFLLNSGEKINFEYDIKFSDELDIITREIQRRMQLAQQIPPSVPEQPVSENPLDQIKKLAELHAMGVLTDNEFESKKQKLLDML